MTTEVTSITKSLDRIADALEGQSGGGSGGGSGDFTTASVTVDSTIPVNSVTLFVARAVDDTISEDGSMSSTMGNIGIPSGTHVITEITAILYKGKCAFICTEPIVKEVSGNATKFGDDTVLITGDCTIVLGE